MSVHAAGDVLLFLSPMGDTILHFFVLDDGQNSPSFFLFLLSSVRAPSPVFSLVLSPVP